MSILTRQKIYTFHYSYIFKFSYNFNNVFLKDVKLPFVYFLIESKQIKPKNEPKMMKTLPSRDVNNSKINLNTKF